MSAGHETSDESGGDRLGQFVRGKGFDQDSVDASVNRLTDHFARPVAGDQDDLQLSIEGAGAADEVQALEMVGPVKPVAAWASAGAGNKLTRS